MKMADLIHAIQGTEGNSECYGQFGTGCPYTDYYFRRDCKKEK